jgi:hypothetical protein
MERRSWQQTDRGFRDRRYEVVLEGPSSWALLVSGRVHGNYPTASAAEREAERLDRVRAKRLSLLKVGSGLVLVFVLFGIVAWQRFGAPPDLESARTRVAELDTAFDQIQSGEASIADFVGPNVSGEPVLLETGEKLDVLVGQVGGSCYVLYWSQTRTRAARVLDVSHGVECDAETAVGIWNLDWIGAPSGWDRLLPSERQERAWFLPAIAVLVGVGLSLLWQFFVALARSVS